MGPRVDKLHALLWFMPEPGSRVRPTIESLQVLWSDGHDAVPDDLSHFGVLVWVLLTIDGALGMDRFDLWVCSPSWLAEAYSQRPLPDPLEWMNGEADWMSYVMLMRSWDEDLLRQRIDALCEEHASSTWPITALRLNRYMLWEYDYRFDAFLGEHPDKPLPRRTREAR